MGWLSRGPRLCTYFFPGGRQPSQPFLHIAVLIKQAPAAPSDAEYGSLLLLCVTFTCYRVLAAATSWIVLGFVLI